MTRHAYRYQFADSVPPERIEETLLLVLVAVEGLHGRSPLRLDAAFRLDRAARSCVVDASTEVGRALARIFTSLLSEQVGEEAFRVERVSDHNQDGAAR